MSLGLLSLLYASVFTVLIYITVNDLVCYHLIKSNNFIKLEGIPMSDYGDNEFTRSGLCVMTTPSAFDL